MEENKKSGTGGVFDEHEKHLFRCSMTVEGHVTCMCMCPLVHASTSVAVYVLWVLHWLPEKCFTLALGMFSGLQANVPSGMVS